MKRWLNKIKKVAEMLDWSVDIDEQNGEAYIEFEKDSPAGEDFVFSAYGDDMEKMTANVEDYASCFDEEEHVRELLNAKANGFSGVPSARELVDDADEIKKMLNELAGALREAA